MKIVLLSLVLLVFSGCVQKTIYEQCNENDEYQRYGGLNQCMAEKRQQEQNDMRGWQSLSDQIKSNQQPSAYEVLYK